MKFITISFQTSDGGEMCWSRPLNGLGKYLFVGK